MQVMASVPYGSRVSKTQFCLLLDPELMFVTVLFPHLILAGEYHSSYTTQHLC